MLSGSRLRRCAVTTFTVAGIAAQAAACAAQAMDLNAEAHTVKVLSSPCGHELRRFAGSGLLFRHGERAYVIGSEHTVIHSDSKEICHRVWNSRFGERKAVLVIADWGTGLALLDAGSASDFGGNLPGIDVFSVQAPRLGSAAKVSGFAAVSRSRTEGSGGRVTAVSSDRHWFPTLASATELQGARAEFGMSGGPVISPGGSRVLGVLSHQYIERLPGRRSEVRFLDESVRVVPDHLFFIPSPEVRNWLDTVFRPGQRGSGLIRDAGAQLKGKAEILSHALRLKPLAVSASDDKTIGGDGIGIGGDGIGIGGASAGNGRTEIRVGISVLTSTEIRALPAFLSAHGNSNGPLPVRPDWSIRLKSALLQSRSNALAEGFVRMDESSGIIEMTGILSPEDFFRKLAKEDLRPVIRLKSRISTLEKGRSRAAEALVETGERIIAELRRAELRTLDRAGESLDHTSVDAALLMESLKGVGALLASGNGNLLREESMEKLKNHPGWDTLFRFRFREATNLYSLLNHAVENLARLSPL